MENKDRITHTKEEISQMHIVLKDGTRVPTQGKTIYTHWESGRIDCNVVLQKPV